MSEITKNLMKEEIAKKEAAEKARLEEMFATTAQKDIPTTIKDLEKINGKAIRFPNGLVAFVGGKDEEDLKNGVEFVEDYAASHKDHPMDIIVAQEHKDAGLNPDAEIEVNGMRLLYYKETQNLRNLAGQEIVNLDDIPGAIVIPTEAALELLKRRAEDFLDDYDEDDEYDDEEDY